MKHMLRMAVAALALAGLSGCVIAPADPSPYTYGYGYAPGYAVYPPPVTLGFGFGECFNCGWHHHHYWR